MEHLYSGHHWDHSKCPDFRGFLISGVDFIHICMYLWQNQVSRFEGVQSEGFQCIINLPISTMANSNDIFWFVLQALDKNFKESIFTNKLKGSSYEYNELPLEQPLYIYTKIILGHQLVGKNLLYQ